MSKVLEQLKQDLAEVPWKDLRIHLQRDAIVLVADSLVLLDVAVAVAEDNSPLVEGWIAASALTKPTAEQISAWETELNKPFQMLIVQPFILLQATQHG